MNTSKYSNYFHSQPNFIYFLIHLQFFNSFVYRCDLINNCENPFEIIAYKMIPNWNKLWFLNLLSSFHSQILFYYLTLPFQFPSTNLCPITPQINSPTVKHPVNILQLKRPLSTNFSDCTQQTISFVLPKSLHLDPNKSIKKPSFNSSFLILISSSFTLKPSKTLPKNRLSFNSTWWKILFKENSQNVPKYSPVLKPNQWQHHIWEEARKKTGA